MENRSWLKVPMLQCWIWISVTTVYTAHKKFYQSILPYFLLEPKNIKHLILANFHTIKLFINFRPQE